MRGDHDDVALLAHGQALGVDNEVERLVPGDVLEAQRQAATDGVADHEIEAGKVGQHLQGGAHVDVLKVERKFLARIAELVDLLFLGTLDDRFDADGEHVASLVGDVLVASLGRDHHARVGALRIGVDGLDRRSEIDHIEAPLQAARHAGVEEIDDDFAGLLADVDSDRRIRQANDDLAVALRAAAEIDARQGVLAGLAAAGETRGLDVLSAGRGRGRRCQGDHEIVAVDRGGIGDRLDQAEHDARAAVTVDRGKRRQRALLDGQVFLGQRHAHTGEIERDACRLGDGEGARLRRRTRHAQRQLHAVTRKLGVEHFIDGVGGRHLPLLRERRSTGAGRRGRRIASGGGQFNGDLETSLNLLDLERALAIEYEIDVHTLAVVSRIGIDALDTLVAAQLGQGRAHAATVQAQSLAQAVLQALGLEIGIAGNLDLNHRLVAGLPSQGFDRTGAGRRQRSTIEQQAEHGKHQHPAMNVNVTYCHHDPPPVK